MEKGGGGRVRGVRGVSAAICNGSRPEYGRVCESEPQTRAVVRQCAKVAGCGEAAARRRDDEDGEWTSETTSSGTGAGLR